MPPANHLGMRPRTELAVGVGLLIVLGIGAAALGSRRARVTDTDPRRSTYLSGPSGARGFADALETIGVRVIRHRRSVESLDSVARPESTLVAILGPTVPLTPREGARVAEGSADLLLAGTGTERAAMCLGYRIDARKPAAIISPLPDREHQFFAARTELVRHLAMTITDSSDLADGRVVTCTVPVPRSVDTILTSAGDRPVALTLTYENGRRVVLVADDRLFTNRALRETAAGPFALGLVVPRYATLVVDELHHGYEGGGSLAGATLDWSLRSPWGWAAWQVAIVGLIGAAGRGHPLRPGPDGHRAPPALAARARARPRDGARGRTRTRRGGAADGPGASAPALGHRTAEPGRSGRVAYGALAVAAYRAGARGPRGHHRSHPPPTGRRRGAEGGQRRGDAVGRAEAEVSAESAQAILDQLRRVVLGQEAALRDVGRRPDRSRPRAARRRARHRQDAARTHARPHPRPRVSPHSVHAGPDAVGHHGSEPAVAAGRVHLPARADLRRPGAGGRDQSRPGKDPGGACSRRCRSVE